MLGSLEKWSETKMDKISKGARNVDDKPYLIFKHNDPPERGQNWIHGELWQKKMLTKDTIKYISDTKLNM